MDLPIRLAGGSTRLAQKKVTDLRENSRNAFLSPTLMAPITPKRSHKQQIRTPKRQEILDRHHLLHQKPPQIKESTGVPTPTVRRVIKSGEPRHASKSHTGRPSKINARDLRHLIRAITSGQDGRQAVYTQLAKELGIEASATTIRVALRKAGFRRCIACPKPLVSWINRRKRLKWAREHLHWTIEDWCRVIFSDESSFETGQRARKFVSRRSGERYCPDCINSFKHSGRKSIMVWGGICGDQTSDLIHFKKTIRVLKRGKNKGTPRLGLTATDYINQILEPYLRPWYRELEKRQYRPIFMQDGASIHSAKEVQLWLRQAGIETLIWPPSSPDLNPDEYMWKGCKSRIRRYPRLITSTEPLFDAAKEEWIRLGDQGKHLKWISTMRERCQTVINNRGFSTKF